MWVIKLGGSLYGSAALPLWLEALAAAPGPLVIVPGGGPFADAVRTAQARFGLGDAAAHDMALLAMDQFGRMLAAMRSDLRPAASDAALGRLRRAGAMAVWLPSRMLIGCSDIQASWAVTSDSLAAWLARRLDAHGLLLVKSVGPSAEAARAEDLARNGIIDEAFPEMIRGACFDTRWVGPGAHEIAAQDLARGHAPGARILQRFSF